MSNEMYMLQQHKQTIKYLESEGSDPEHYQALEQRLTEFAVGRLLAHYDGAQLTVVPDQHQLLGTQHRGHHALRLRGTPLLLLSRSSFSFGASLASLRS